MGIRRRARALVQRVDHAVRRRLTSRTLAFTSIFLAKTWGKHDGSMSGSGSSTRETEVVRATLPTLLREFDVTSMLDVPCGDHAWMSGLSLGRTRYLGGDVVPLLVMKNRLKHRHRDFAVMDVVTGPIPRADLIFCRDCLVHLKDDDVRRALDTMSKSGARYLLTTTFPDHDNSALATTGDWRALNLEAPPFSLPPPLRLVVENCPDPRYRDKALGLWALPFPTTP